MNYFRLIRPLLHALPPEAAHEAALMALRCNVLPKPSDPIPAMLETRAFGLSFPGPVGLAAGFDKNAEAVSALLGQGFGFVEAGTCTPKAQAGNPKPRLFRLGEDEAVINRLGFNGRGKDVFVANLAKRASSGIVGANIGKNRDSTDAIADYVTMLEAVASHADYIAVNISSPNTEGLRALQEKDTLDALVLALLAKRAQLKKNIPVLLKIAPDLSDAQQMAIASVALERGVDGLIVGNTTVSRPENLRSRNRNEKGGLSGRPLFSLSTEVLRNIYRMTHGNIPLIGVGGIASGEDAYAKIRAGASLVQLYTALIYQGLGLMHEIHATLAVLLARDGFKSVSEAVGADAKK